MKTTTKALALTGAALALLAIGRFSSGWGGPADAEAQQHVHSADSEGDEEGQAADTARKVAICKRCRGLASGRTWLQFRLDSGGTWHFPHKASLRRVSI